MGSRNELNPLGKVQIIFTDKLDKGTIRTRIKINGHTFVRLQNDGYPIVWNDLFGTFNGCSAMTTEQESELESIFQAYIIELKTAQP